MLYTSAPPYTGSESLTHSAPGNLCSALWTMPSLRTFICTDASLSTQEILDTYVARWPVELFFRQSKDCLAFEGYQIRSAQGIRRYWLLMSLAHFLCCTGTSKDCPFEDGYSFFRQNIQEERIEYLYRCGVRRIPLEEVLALAA